MRKFLLILILILGLYFRFIGVNWDQSQHLHPDERFLTMVGNAMKVPKSFSDYLNSKISTFNPENIGYNFYVYGTFPVVLNKLLAIINRADNYNLFTIQGRMLSAFFDLLIIILVYKTTQLLCHPERSEGSSDRRSRNASLDSSVTEPVLSKIEGLPQNDGVALWSAFFYAVAVYPIQSSHFFTVDTFLNFFMFAAFYFALRFWTRRAPDGDPSSQNDVILVSGRSPRVQNLIFSAIFFGLALACKISAIYLLPLILLMFLIRTVLIKDSPSKGQSFCGSVLLLVGFVLLSYFVLRLASPYYFQSANFFDPRLSSSFVNSIKSLTQFTRPDVWYPPAVQWINKSVTFLLTNLALVGVGLPYFVLIIIGMMFVIPTKRPTRLRSGQSPGARGEIFKRFLDFARNDILFFILLWVVGYFLYQSFQFVKSIRYTIYLYPFFAIFAGLGTSVILTLSETKWKNLAKPGSVRYLAKRFYGGLIIILVLIWPLLFSTIYLSKHTRVEASEWIYKNLSNNSLILWEHWDDPLPLNLENNYGKIFRLEQLNVFDPDDQEKMEKINQQLKEADYYILSSNRGWGSVTTAAKKYPLMSQFYQDLFAEKLGYKKIKEFTSYPNFSFFIFHLSFPDDWSEETFTVYDHPQVLIYQNERN